MIVSGLNKTLLKKKILVIGAGSIGRRHIANLLHLGFTDIYAFRRKGSDSNLIINGHQVIVLSEWKDVINLKIYAAIICSPTSLHLPQALKCLKIGSHLVIEKPLSYSLLGLAKLKKEITDSRKLVVVAYMLRFHPLLKKVKEFVDNKTHGNLISFSSKWGEYLPGWHPSEDYRQSYAARRELGGGVTLTLSHDIDIVNWITGSKITRTKSIKNYRSKLEIDVESGCDILYEYSNGVTGHSHLNYYSKSHERYIEFIFDEANIRFDYIQSTLKISKPGSKEKLIQVKNFERNDLFIDELVEFFQKTIKFTLRDSIKAVEESEIIMNICKKENWKNG